MNYQRGFDLQKKTNFYKIRLLVVYTLKNKKD